jgi:uncharacterized protein
LSTKSKKTVAKVTPAKKTPPPPRKKGSGAIKNVTQAKKSTVKITKETTKKGVSKKQVAAKSAKPSPKKASPKPLSKSVKSTSKKAVKPATTLAPKKPVMATKAPLNRNGSVSAKKKPAPPVSASRITKPDEASRLKPTKAEIEIVSKKAPSRKAMEVPPPSNTKPEIVAKIRMAQAEKELRKDLAQPAPKASLVPLTPVPPVVKGKDRLILMVRDPYWLHAHWDVTRQTVDRAKVSLAENWHTVKPILRLLKMDDSGTTSNAETVYRDIEIHGGVRNWYIEVDSPPSRFRVLMGYLSSNDRFYELARSNTVVTPVPGGKEATDDHWADIAKDAERIYSMSGGYGDDTQTGDLTEVFEERLKRTMDADVLSQFGSGAEGSLKRHKHFHFDVDAELVVFGSTHPEAHVTVGTEPVKVRNDGSFSIRMPLPDRRQVLPATAKSRDGVDEQTVVIAVERNTKVMEPLSMDSEDL